MLGQRRWATGGPDSWEAVLCGPPYDPLHPEEMSLWLGDSKESWPSPVQLGTTQSRRTRAEQEGKGRRVPGGLGPRLLPLGTGAPSSQAFTLRPEFHPQGPGASTIRRVSSHRKPLPVGLYLWPCWCVSPESPTRGVGGYILTLI